MLVAAHHPNPSSGREHRALAVRVVLVVRVAGVGASTARTPRPGPWREPEPTLAWNPGSILRPRHATSLTVTATIVLASGRMRSVARIAAVSLVILCCLGCGESTLIRTRLPCE